MPETTASFFVDRFDRKVFPAAPIFLQPGTPEVLRVEAKQDGRAKEASKCQPAAEETWGETRTIVLRPQTVACGDYARSPSPNEN